MRMIVKNLFYIFFRILQRDIVWNTDSCYKYLFWKVRSGSMEQSKNDLLSNRNLGVKIISCRNISFLS